MLMTSSDHGREFMSDHGREEITPAESDVADWASKKEFPRATREPWSGDDESEGDAEDASLRRGGSQLLAEAMRRGHEASGSEVSEALDDRDHQHHRHDPHDHHDEQQQRHKHHRDDLDVSGADEDGDGGEEEGGLGELRSFLLGVSEEKLGLIAEVSSNLLPLYEPDRRSPILTKGMSIPDQWRGNVQVLFPV